MSSQLNELVRTSDLSTILKDVLLFTASHQRRQRWGNSYLHGLKRKKISYSMKTVSLPDADLM